MKKNMRVNNLIIVGLVLGIIISGVALTYSFLTESSNTLTSSTNIGNVQVEVIDTSSKGNTSFKLRNNGDTPEYIRISLISHYVDNDGNVIARPAPKLNFDYNSNWIYQNGIYYFKNPVHVGEEIEFLDSPVSLIADEEGYKQSFEVLASSIQAYPSTAAKMYWKADIINARIINIE